MLIAITREVSPGIGECELTHVPRQEINLELAQAQHQAYENALRAMGCEIRTLPVEPDQPDSVFVEDTAIVLDDLGIIARTGTVSRREETRNVMSVLKEYRKLFHIESPGTLEGGDALQIGKTIYVGVSSRTNQSGITQLKEFVSPYQYDIVIVKVDGCLHLKSAITSIGEDIFLVNRSWIDTRPFGGKELIDVDPDEPSAANALLVGGEVLYPMNFPKTLQRLERRGIPVRGVDVSELQKAEGALTCCSLIFRK